MDLEDRDMPKFLALTACVSNHCAEIAADWRTYETNEMVRFTTLSAVGYSGYSNFTNFADIVTTRRLSDPSLFLGILLVSCSRHTEHHVIQV